MIVAKYIVEFLNRIGVDTVFGYQGGNISILIDELGRSSLNFVSTYNEQGASFAANGYSEYKKNIGVAISSSGPGAINMLNGIANAYFDGLPCLFITGDVNTASQKKYKGVRQSGFQEVDIVRMAEPVTKGAFSVTPNTDIPTLLLKCYELMFEGRKGPVLLNIPHNVQRMEVDRSDILLPSSMPSVTRNTRKIENEISEALASAVHPLLILGNGCWDIQAQLRTWINTAGIPFCTTLKAIDFCPESIYAQGLIGTYGVEKVSSSFRESDLIIVLGARLDERVVGPFVEILEDKKVIYIDIDKAELSKFSDYGWSLYLADLRDIDFQKIVSKTFYANNDVKRTIVDDSSLTYSSFFNALRFEKKSSISLDVGLNQMAAAKYLRLKAGDRVLSSGGLGSMGFSLPASIGSWYTDKDIQIVSFMGDGGLQMNIQELEVIRRERIPCKIFVLNNKSLGMIRQYQDLAFQHRYIATVEGFSMPSLSDLAHLYEMSYVRIDSLSDLSKVIRKIENMEESVLVEVVIPVYDNIDN